MNGYENVTVLDQNTVQVTKAATNSGNRKYDTV